MQMKVDLRRKDGNLHFEAVNENGSKVDIDGGEDKKGMRPMELLLTAMGSCSAFDAVLILEKQRQTIDDFTVEVVGERPDEGEPKPYDAIHLKFAIKGKVDESKAERALNLAVEKYCSVAATFRPETKITYEFQILETT